MVVTVMMNKFSKKLKKILCIMICFILILHNIGYCCDCDDEHTCSGGNVSGRISDDFNWTDPYSNIQFWQFYEVGKINEGLVYAPEQTGINADVLYYGEDDGANSGVIKPFTFGGITYGYNDGSFKRNGKNNSGSSGNNIIENRERATYQANNLGQLSYYPFIKMRYASLEDTNYQPAIVVSNNLSSINSFMIAQAAVKNPGNVTLGVDSMWDGWTKTMTGLSDTGILAANGNDKDVVVHGGSTVHIYTADSTSLTKKENIPLADIGIEAYVFAVPESIENTFVDGQAYNNNEAQTLLENFAKDVKKNLGHYRLTKRIAEGIYLQGQEAKFIENSELVDIDPSIRTTNTFGSFDGTASGTSDGNKLDFTHKKYYFNSYIEDDKKNDNSNNITVKMDYDITEFMIKSDIDETDPNSVKHTYIFSTKNLSNVSEDRAISKITDNVTKESSTNSGNLKPNNTNLTWKLGGNVNIGKQEGWKDLNYITGFVDNYINNLDLHEEGNTSNSRTVGNSSNEPNTRNNERRYWYSEGQDGLCVLRLQAHYYLYLDEVKWEVIDPALCGQAKSHYDLRNWSDNNNDGVKDSGLNNGNGVLKDKVRTFRYELSPYFVYNDGDDANNGSYESKCGELVGSTWYLGTIGDPSQKENDEWSLPVYLNDVSSVLSSKLMYLDNCTVEDSNK